MVRGCETASASECGGLTCSSCDATVGVLSIACSGSGSI